MRNSNVDSINANEILSNQDISTAGQPRTLENQPIGLPETIGNNPLKADSFFKKNKNLIMVAGLVVVGFLVYKNFKK